MHGQLLVSTLTFLFPTCSPTLALQVRKKREEAKEPSKLSPCQKQLCILCMKSKLALSLVRVFLGSSRTIDCWCPSSRVLLPRRTSVSILVVASGI